MNFKFTPTAPDAGALIQGKNWQPIVVADRRVVELHGAPFEAPLVTFEPGEGSKCREVKAQLEDEILALGPGRSTCIVGYGGGVALDLAGFIAATLHRGVHLAFIPTTLLAQVDACLGGKNGINTPLGKNLIGTLYHPKIICIDTKYLETLSQDQLRQGSAEMIKHALLADPTLIGKPLKRDLILRNLEIKQSFIEGERDCLNFGHTVGHAIETLSNYTISHGDAVLKGMWVEAILSGCDPPDFLDSKIPYSAQELFAVMRLDKKNTKGVVQISSLLAFGKPGPLKPITEEMLEHALSYATAW